MPAALFLEEEYLQENSSKIFIMTGSSIVLSLLTQWISIFRILFFYRYSIGITSFSPSLDMLIILGVVLMFLEESDTFYSIFWGKTEQPGWMRQRQIRTYRNSGSVAVPGHWKRFGCDWQEICFWHLRFCIRCFWYMIFFPDFPYSRYFSAFSVF